MGDSLMKVKFVCGMYLGKNTMILVTLVKLRRKINATLSLVVIKFLHMVTGAYEMYSYV